MSGEVIKVADFIYDPLHYLALLPEHKSKALDRAGTAERVATRGMCSSAAAADASPDGERRTA